MTDLRLIAWRGYDDREAAAPFLERCGLSLSVTYVDSDEQAVEALQRGALGSVDAVALDERYVPQMLEAGLVAPIDYTRLPSTASYLDPFARLARKAPGGGRWSAPFIWGTHPMAYNAAYVTRSPSSWLDVLEPEYEGRVAMLDGPIHQIIIWGRVLGYRDPTRISHAQLEAAIDLAVKVKRRTRARLVSWDELPGVLARGNVWIATAGWEAVGRFASVLGADVRLAQPREGSYPWLDSWCIPRSPPNEAAAYGWIDWMIGPQAQAVVARNLPCGAVNRQALPLLEPEARDPFPYADVGEMFAWPRYVGIPPRAAEDDVATLADWNKAWEVVRAA